MKQIKIQQQNFVLHSSGAIYWIEKATLMLADPHLGKIAHFRKNGIAVPRKAEGVFYNKVARIVDQFEIKRFLFLGDLFHSYQNNEWYMFRSWVKNQKAKIILVEGNHDVIPAYKFEKIGITVVKELIEEYFCFSHFPSKKEGYFTFCGHVHPGIKLKGSGLQKLKMPCFFNSTYQMILPAFGAFTGLHILIPKKEDKIYVTTGKEVIEIGEN
ncbi:MAG: ligase-associated DNA damage response endonuclease PdeM [Flavobacteriaceae bacterium TMED147]|jgi:DNA ligase-associated metallophosphoesterase|nr:MAG: ligase-associated DNA damage response endonuclease PdeM [Flavobacteriaceae bacterium TMED147]|tara:strand:- start:216 stop:854 length:639 start_codon:yes stop_codon:yes gene_type:complete